MFQNLKFNENIDSIFSRQGSVLLACQSQKREGIFREYFGALQRGQGRRGFNNIYTLRQKCFLFVCSSYRGLKKNIMLCQRVLNAWHCLVVFTKKYISDFLVCTESCTQPYIMKMAIYPDHLPQRGVVWL